MIDGARPTISVLMPVYNGEKYLRSAIDSILSQTFKDFEFLIINDGSVDSSRKIVLSYDDPRIRFVENEKNLGIVETLNRGIDLAQGKYIARMDCDDMSHADRLEKQLDFMEKNPVIGVCGLWIETIGGRRKHIWKFPTDSEEIRCRLLFENPLPHPGVMICLEFLKKYSLRYEKEYLYCEDYALWSRCAKYFPLANIPEILLRYRLHAGQSMKKSLEKAEDFNASILRIAKEQFGYLGLGLDEKGANAYLTIREIARLNIDLDMLNEMEKLLNKIMEANDHLGYFEKNSLEKEIRERWFAICNFSTYLGLRVYDKYFGSVNLRSEELSKIKKSIFYLKCIMKFDRKKILRLFSL